MYTVFKILKKYVKWIFHQEALPSSIKSEIQVSKKDFLRFIVSTEKLEQKKKTSIPRKSFIRWVLSPEVLEQKTPFKMPEEQFSRWIFKKENL